VIPGPTLHSKQAAVTSTLVCGGAEPIDNFARRALPPLAPSRKGSFRMVNEASSRSAKRLRTFAWLDWRQEYSHSPGRGSACPLCGSHRFPTWSPISLSKHKGLNGYAGLMPL